MPVNPLLPCPRCSAELTPAEVRSLAGKLSASMRRVRRGAAAAIHPEAVPEIRAAIDAGESIRSIAERLGVHPATVTRTLKRGETP